MDKAVEVLDENGRMTWIMSSRHDGDALYDRENCIQVVKTRS